MQLVTFDGSVFLCAHQPNPTQPDPTQPNPPPAAPPRAQTPLSLAAQRPKATPAADRPSDARTYFGAQLLPRREASSRRPQNPQFHAHSRTCKHLSDISSCFPYPADTPLWKAPISPCARACVQPAQRGRTGNYGHEGLVSRSYMRAAAGV